MSLASWPSWTLLILFPIPEVQFCARLTISSILLHSSDKTKLTMYSFSFYRCWHFIPTCDSQVFPILFLFPSRVWVLALHSHSSCNHCLTVLHMTCNTPAFWYINYENSSKYHHGCYINNIMHLNLHAGLCALSPNQENCYLALPASTSTGVVLVYDALDLHALCQVLI